MSLSMGFFNGVFQIAPTIEPDMYPFMKWIYRLLWIPGRYNYYMLIFNDKS
jgi:hypothetical protein